MEKRTFLSPHLGAWNLQGEICTPKRWGFCAQGAGKSLYAEASILFMQVQNVKWLERNDRCFAFQMQEMYSDMKLSQSKDT